MKNIRTHVFTNIPSFLFLKQSRDFSHVVDDVEFSFGLEVPENIDVLILYTRASYSVPTKLPKSRTAFFAGEPDVIHPYKSSYLNQFGLVISSTSQILNTEHWRNSACSMPFVGMDFRNLENSQSIFDFEKMPIPKKLDDKISIVTSHKSFTQYHRDRNQFIEQLIDKIPEKLEIFGRGRKSVHDKKDAILPFKYHIALENGGGPFAWTEKLADPLLCYSYPFYFGCDNLEEDMPSNCFEYINIYNVDDAINQMMSAVKNNTWKANLPAIRDGRSLIFTKFNLMNKFAEISHHLVNKAPDIPLSTKNNLVLRSERSHWPEAGTRGNYIEMMLRRVLISIHPNTELRFAKLNKKFEQIRISRRNRKIKKIESRK